MLLRKLPTFEMASQSRDNPATARGPRGNSTHGKSRTIPGRLTYRSWTWVKHFPFVCKELLHKSKVSPWFVVKVREMPLVFSSLICSRGLLAGNRFLIWRGCDKFGYCAHHLHSARSDLWGQSNCIHVYIYIQDIQALSQSATIHPCVINPYRAHIHFPWWNSCGQFAGKTNPCERVLIPQVSYNVCMGMGRVS